MTQQLNSACGCEKSCTPRWSPEPNCNHGCPEPPWLPPCQLIDGVAYYHECHPLVPMAQELSCGGVCADDHQLGCYLKMAEPLYSTCKFPGDSYYQAICYHALAIAEYRQRLETYQFALNSAIALGKSFNVPPPTLFNSGIFGLQLQSMIDSFSGSFFISAI